MWAPACVCRSLALLIATAAVGAVLAVPDDSSTVLAMTRFDVLVEALPQASSVERRAFADAALAALIEANAAEAEGNASAGAAQVWRRGTRDYVARLQEIRLQLQRGAPLDIVREGRHAVRLIVGSEQVMLSAPRVSTQAAFESAIAESVCAVYDCAATPTIDEIVGAREHVNGGEWSLADRTPPLFAQADGLHCVFEDMLHLRLKQRACERITRELRMLEEALRAVLQHGGSVDWRALRVGTGTGANVDGSAAARRRVSYATNGRYFELDLPLLAAAPEVVQGAIPWLQTRLRGQAAIYVITAPERLAYRVTDTN